MHKLITTLGDYGAAELGMILAHEHLFVDLGPIELESYRHADVAEAVACMTPELVKIAAQGVTALVECTPVGVGRRADIDLAISRSAQFPVVLPTGVYREPWVPAWVHRATEGELTEWMVKELTVGIEETGIRAAWIKVSAGDDGMTDCERKILRAAGRAGVATGAIIGSHTIRGRVVLDQLAVIEEVGYRAERFIWIHTQAESDERFYDKVAARGAWLEFDAIGSPGYGDGWFIDAIRRVIDAGYGQRLLLSQDRGWYDPSKPGGGPVKPFTYLLDQFMPRLRDSGLDESWVQQLMVTNPFAAYARDID